MTERGKPFGDWAEKAKDNGFEPMPMNGKRPALKNWNSRPLGLQAIRNLLERDDSDYRSANLGFRAGKLLAIDIDDTDGERACRLAALVQGAIGFTRFVRIGNWPKRTLFYRLDTPMRSKRIGSVDILSAGRNTVVMGIHPDTGRPYCWPDECLVDHMFDRLPVVSGAALNDLIRHLELFHQTHKQERGEQLAATLLPAVEKTETKRPSSRRGSGGKREFITSPVEGERNNAIFAKLAAAARTCAKKPDLMRRAIDMNSSCCPPLESEEVARIVDSVWRYKKAGRLLVPGNQSILLPFGKDVITALHRLPEATHLYAHLKATRKKTPFEIPQKATAKSLGWGDNRLRGAISKLIEVGLLQRISNGGKRGNVCNPDRYRWAGL